MESRKILFFSILILFVISPVRGENEIVSWSQDLKKGDVFSWKYVKYQDPGNPSSNVLGELHENAVVDIKLLNAPSEISLENSSCDALDCYLLNASTTNTYFDMKIDGQVKNGTYVAKNIAFYINPIIVGSSFEDENILAGWNGTTENSNEFVYKELVEYPDNYINTTIRWEKSTGVMNYYEMQKSGFAFVIHIKVEREISIKRELYYPTYQIIVALIVISGVKRIKEKSAKFAF